jgi:hypothetical protein
MSKAKRYFYYDVETLDEIETFLDARAKKLVSALRAEYENEKKRYIGFENIQVRLGYKQRASLRRLISELNESGIIEKRQAEVDGELSNIDQFQLPKKRLENLDYKNAELDILENPLGVINKIAGFGYAFMMLLRTLPNREPLSEPRTLILKLNNNENIHLSIAPTAGRQTATMQHVKILFAMISLVTERLRYKTNNSSSYRTFKI